MAVYQVLLLPAAAAPDDAAAGTAATADPSPAAAPAADAAAAAAAEPAAPAAAAPRYAPPLIAVAAELAGPANPPAAAAAAAVARLEPPPDDLVHLVFPAGLHFLAPPATAPDARRMTRLHAFRATSAAGQLCGHAVVVWEPARDTGSLGATVYTLLTPAPHFETARAVLTSFAATLPPVHTPLPPPADAAAALLAHATESVTPPVPFPAALPLPTLRHAGVVLPHGGGHTWELPQYGWTCPGAGGAGDASHSVPGVRRSALVASLAREADTLLAAGLSAAGDVGAAAPVCTSAPSPPPPQPLLRLLSAGRCWCTPASRPTCPAAAAAATFPPRPHLAARLRSVDAGMCYPCAVRVALDEAAAAGEVDEAEADAAIAACAAEAAATTTDPLLWDPMTPHVWLPPTSVPSSVRLYLDVSATAAATAAAGPAPVPLPFHLPLRTPHLPPADVDVRPLFARLAPRHVALLVNALLLERTVIVTSSDVTVLPDVLEAALALTYPLLWVHPYAPVLQTDAYAALPELCRNAPCALLLGCHTPSLLAAAAGTARPPWADDAAAVTGAHVAAPLAQERMASMDAPVGTGAGAAAADFERVRSWRPMLVVDLDRDVVLWSTDVLKPEHLLAHALGERLQAAMLACANLWSWAHPGAWLPPERPFVVRPLLEVEETAARDLERHRRTVAKLRPWPTGPAPAAIRHYHDDDDDGGDGDGGGGDGGDGGGAHADEVKPIAPSLPPATSALLLDSLYLCPAPRPTSPPADDGSPPAALGTPTGGGRSRSATRHTLAALHDKPLPTLTLEETQREIAAGIEAAASGAAGGASAAVTLTSGGLWPPGPTALSQDASPILVVPPWAMWRHALCVRQEVAAAGGRATCVDPASLAVMHVPPPPLHWARLRIAFMESFADMFRGVRLYLRVVPDAPPRPRPAGDMPSPLPSAPPSPPLVGGRALELAPTGPVLPAPVVLPPTPLTPAPVPEPAAPATSSSSSNGRLEVDTERFLAEECDVQYHSFVSALVRTAMFFSFSRRRLALLAPDPFDLACLRFVAQSMQEQTRNLRTPCASPLWLSLVQPEGGGGGGGGSGSVRVGNLPAGKWPAASTAWAELAPELRVVVVWDRPPDDTGAAGMSDVHALRGGALVPAATRKPVAAFSITAGVSSVALPSEPAAVGGSHSVAYPHLFTLRSVSLLTPATAGARGSTAIPGAGSWLPAGPAPLHYNVTVGAPTAAARRDWLLHLRPRLMTTSTAARYHDGLLALYAVTSRPHIAVAADARLLHAALVASFASLGVLPGVVGGSGGGGGGGGAAGRAGGR